MSSWAAWQCSQWVQEIIPLLPCISTHGIHLECSSHFWPPQDMAWVCWNETHGGHQWSGSQSTGLTRRDWASHGCSAWKKKIQGANIITACNYLIRGYQGVRLVLEVHSNRKKGTWKIPVRLYFLNTRIFSLRGSVFLLGGVQNSTGQLEDLGLGSLLNYSVILWFCNCLNREPTRRWL